MVCTNVGKKELNLLKFTAVCTTEASVAFAEAVGRKFADANPGGELLYDMPDELFRHSFAPDSTGATHPSEKLPALIPAAPVHSSKKPCTQSGTGMVRT